MPRSKSAPLSIGADNFNLSYEIAAILVVIGVMSVVAAFRNQTGIGTDRDVSGSQADIGPRLWATAADSSRIVWIGVGEQGAILHSKALNGPPGESLEIGLPYGRHPLAVTILTDGSLAIVFDDAAVVWWDGATGQALGEQRLPLSTATRATAAGDLVTVASDADLTAMTLSYRAGSWVLSGAAEPLKPSDGLVFPPQAFE